MFKGVFTVLRSVLPWLLAALFCVSALAITDPTRPEQYRAAPARVSYHLESILFSNSRRVAIINGKVLAEGESIGGATVTAIAKDSVRLQRSGRIIRLSLQHPNIRRDQ